MKLVLDAGGTSIRAQIYEHGMCVTTLHAKSREKGLAAYIEEVLATYGAIEVVCISYAGQVREGVILSAPNITVDRHDIKKYFAAKYGIEVLIENDLNCAVLAEAKEHESGDICAVYVGTGLGLGVLSGGNLVRGASSVATELGHIPYKKAPFACGCGRENCIELFASGSALEKWSRYYLLGSCELEALRTSEAAHAKEVYEEFIKALLAALGTVVTLFNPKVLVLGGGVIENNPFLYEIILQNIPLYALGVSLEGLKIVQTTIEDAPLKGAYLLKDTNE
ncbi:MAG: ROK family protein [Thiovulaceae bacterium]|nr:ROK family protein [Sulfurimonadaceae bacterium]MDD3817356.1 ROK family protein [Sulfurimonadaceae bacterium]